MGIAVRGLAPLFQVFDMPKALAFYRDRLGFEVLETSGAGDRSGWVLLGLDGAELMLNTAYEDDERPASASPSRTAAHRDTTIFFGCPNVDAAYEHLRAHGVHVAAPVVTSYGFKSICVTDPDGYELCFHWPATKIARARWLQRYGREVE